MKVAGFNGTDYDEALTHSIGTTKADVSFDLSSFAYTKLKVNSTTLMTIYSITLTYIK